MKHIGLFALTVTLALTLAGCSSDADFDKQQGQTDDNTKYIINVSAKKGFGGDTRAYRDKTEWEDGDVIYILTADNKDAMLKITYDSQNGWKMEISKQPFQNDRGTITAVYSSNIDMNADGSLSMSGDVLYTDEGYYERADNAVYTNLPMNIRPLAKINVTGIGGGCSLKAKKFSTLASLSPIAWADSTDVLPFNYENGTATYFGMIAPNADGTTTVELVDEFTGMTYTRTFNNAMQAGDAIAINGPLSNESGMWEQSIQIVRIDLDKTDAILLLGEEMDLTATIVPGNAPNKEIIWTSSNENIATVTPGEASNTAHVKALAKGTAVITATAADGGETATCKIEVGEVSDYVKTSVTTFAGMQINNWISGSFGIRVENNLSETIRLTSIQVYNADTNELLVNAYPSDDIDVDIESNTSNAYSVDIQARCTNFLFVINFLYQGKEYSSNFIY